MRIAQDPNAALVAIRAAAPDLILIHSRPGFDGIEACRALHLALAARAIPILLVGAFDTTDEIARALGAGAIDILRASFTAELLRARVRILSALVQAESAHRRSSALLTNVVYEVRAAMPAILGMSDLALQSGLDARQRQSVERAARSGEMLLDTLADILDVSAHTGATRAPEPTSAFVLDEVLDSVAKLVGLKADAKGLELLFDLPADLPAALIGDAGRLRRILIDLGTRAVRAAPNGDVVIGIRSLERDAAHAQLRFFVHAVSAANDAAPGQGFEISRHLLALMGSTLETEEAPDRRALRAFAVNFELPREVPAPWSPPATNGARVLVVDDNARARGLLTAMCGALGLQADSAGDGWDALRTIDMAHRAGRPFTLVLLDASMPTMDGPECARLLKRGDSHPPVVMTIGMFAEDEVLHRLAANEVSVRAFLTKPVTPAALREAYAGATLLASDLGPPPDSCPGPLALSRRAAPMEGKRVLLVDDNHIIQELALELLRNAGMVVTPATNGREALECMAAASFDLVLMDCQMPVMDGFDATRAIRAQPQYAKLPVIALTAGLTDADRDRVMRSGMNDIIPKPIDVDKMFQTLTRWLSLGASAAPPAAPSITGDPLMHLQGIDARIGRASTMNNDTLYRRLLGMFRDGQRNFPAQFRAAREAGDLVTATRLVHNLRAVSGSLGAVAVQNAAMTLEGACTVNANTEAITDLLDTVITELDPVLASLAEMAP